MENQQPAQQPAQSAPQQPAQQQPLINPQQKLRAVQEVVLDAQRIMYSKETRAVFMQELKDGDLIKTSANTAVNLMLILLQKSKMTMNVEVVIPAGVIILGEIMDFLEKSRDIKFADPDVKRAIKLFCQTMIAKTTPKGAQKPAQQPQGLLSQPSAQRPVQPPMQQPRPVQPIQGVAR